MKYTTKKGVRQILGVRLQLVLVISWLLIGVSGQVVESSGGWVSCPPQGISLRGSKGQGRREKRSGKRKGGWGRLSVERVVQRMRVPASRSLLLGVLWLGSGGQRGGWLMCLPWLVWLWEEVGWGWPWLRREPEWRWGAWVLWQGQRLVLVGYLGQWVEAGLRGISLVEWEGISSQVRVSLGCLICGADEPWVKVGRGEDGSYEGELCGHFKLKAAGDEPFRMRLLILFVRSLTVPGPERIIGRTRDDRAPFVRQVQVAQWFGITQPEVSRWERYYLEGEWPKLLSLRGVEILTEEVRAEIIRVCVAFPWWGLAKIHGYLQQQGRPISYNQVRQTVQESGWGQLRQQLQRRYQLSAESFRPRDNWLVEALLAQVEDLLVKVEQGQGLTEQEQLSLSDLQTLAAEIGLTPQVPLKALPWLMRAEQLVFGQWELVTDEQVRCLYCGSCQVAQKSKQPRLKKFYDDQGQLQHCAVYRYYCRNKECDKGSFTNLPPGLVPYSPYRLETKLLALHMYAWGQSNYRRTGQALGLKSMTIYRWVSAWGYELLPVAALFGVLKSSGVVGVDEKYVLVPKNDKPQGKMRRWMYVYLAVDVYTYDLLHIAIYPHNDKRSAQAFLLALRAKGYQPRVIVTDLRRDYGGDIARVFPNASHHECIFHALKDITTSCRDIYGSDFAHTQPQVEQLRQAINHIFQAKTKRTAQKRYDKVIALRDQYVQQQAEAAAIFDFLERHWPKLVNAIESQLIPKTNNATELVIRRFDQHYQAFCGFHSINTARRFLALFEKTYRFTPFSDDAQPAIRGKSPLQLAGYDISQLPFNALGHGLSPDWPFPKEVHFVPK